MSKSRGVFQIDDVTRTMSKGGGCAWCSTHPSSDPPPTWLAGYGPAYHNTNIVFIINGIRGVRVRCYVVMYLRYSKIPGS